MVVILPFFQTMLGFYLFQFALRDMCGVNTKFLNTHLQSTPFSGFSKHIMTTKYIDYLFVILLSYTSHIKLFPIR